MTHMRMLILRVRVWGLGCGSWWVYGSGVKVSGFPSSLPVVHNHGGFRFEVQGVGLFPSQFLWFVWFSG